MTSLRSPVKLLGVVLFALLWQLVATTVQAHTIALTNNNAVAEIDPHSQAGVFKLQVEGISQLAQEWFWLRRSADTQESPVSALPLTVENQTSPNVLQVTYSDGTTSVSITFILTGGPSGTGVASLSEVVSATGLANGRLFEYSDFNLNGSPSDDSSSFINVNRVDQSDPSTTMAETDVTPAPQRREAALVPIILNKLNNASLDDLADLNGGASAAVGPGDVAWAYEWTVPGTGNLLISKQKAFNVTVTPCVKVIKKIACRPADGNCAAAATYASSATGAKSNTQDPAFCYSITVTNCGNVALENIAVMDDVLSDVLSAFGTSLPVNGSETHYFSASHNTDTRNTVTVEADGTGSSGHVTSTDHADAFVVVASLSCSKIVTSPADLDGIPNNSHVTLPADGLNHPVTYSVTVTNTGDVAMSNIVITDAMLTSLGCTMPAPFSLGVGKSASFTLCTVGLNCQTAPDNLINVIGQVDAMTGICAYDNNGQIIKASSQCTASVGCGGTPCIKVTKKIACLLTSSTCGTFDKTATGFKGDTQNPAFCYSITVTNCGNVVLSNITVVDDKLGDLSGSYADSLPVGGSETHVFSASWAIDTRNTVTVNGDGASDTGHVMNSDFADAYVVQASISCVKRVSSPDDLDGDPNDNHVSLPTDGNPHVVTYSVTVTAGDVDLVNVTISDPTLTGLSCPMPAAFSLAANTFRTFTLCMVQLNCNNVPSQGLVNTITVSAKVDTSRGGCGYDQNGQPVMVSSKCSGLVACNPMAGGCRTTGGTNKLTNNWQSACITTPKPSFVSIAGQVGAPFAVETAFSPGSVCISGEWQHNRHLPDVKGKPSLVGVLHASGNGNEHQFDSLMCACLPCPENPGAIGVVGNLCNPGDRICGPEPRRAGANKLCFSGVGDFTFTNAKKTVKAVFRVDIEDRGEGNSQANPAPPDRCRMRIWVLDPSCGRSYGPDSAQGLALREAVSCDKTKIANVVTTEDLKNAVLAGLPDIDDGGNLTQGNRQIHPPTGATCK